MSRTATDHLQWLVHTSPSDVNFKASLGEAEIDTLNEALEEAAGGEHGKTRYNAIRSELRRRYKESHNNPDAAEVPTWEESANPSPSDTSHSSLPTPHSSTAQAVEAIAPGELSKALATSLKAHGKDISEQQLANMCAALEETRAEYQTRSILTGIALLAKKSSLKHGKWKVYLEKLFSKNDTRVIFGEGQYRELARYMYLAKRFLWKIESNGFIEETVESDQTAPQITAGQVLELAKSSDANSPLFSEISRFVSGRSLRRMLADFRQADKDADEAHRRKLAARGKASATSDDGSQTSEPQSQPPAPRQTQLLLWEAFKTQKAPILDAVFDEPGTEDLTGEEAQLHYSQLAEEFETRAKRARQLAEAAKSGTAKK